MDKLKPGTSCGCTSIYFAYIIVKTKRLYCCQAEAASVIKVKP